MEAPGRGQVGRSVRRRRSGEIEWQSYLLTPSWWRSIVSLRSGTSRVERWPMRSSLGLCAGGGHDEEEAEGSEVSEPSPYRARNAQWR